MQILPKELLKKAAKNIVRECDEIDKNYFQAYVDEGSASFDVAVSLNDKKEIVTHSCDCGSKTDFCQHKAALLLYIIKEKQGKQPSKGNKKESRLKDLIDEVDAEKLKSWIKEILARNKDLELAFLYQFGNQQKKYSPADIEQLTRDAVKAVIKSKKRAEASEVKRIAELWAEVHDTVVNEYCAQLTDQDAFLNFDALVKIVAEIQLTIATTSNRIKKYLESQLLKVADHLQQLRTDESWTIAVGYFADRIIVDRHKLRVSYLWFLVDVIGVSNGERKTAVINKLVGQYAGCNPIEFFDGSVYTETIFNLVTSNHLFETYYNVFKPIRFNNDYNSDLIGRLIQLGHLNLAETYCQEQIMYNSREEYNHSYYQFLKEIYSIERDNGKLTEVLKKMSLYTFDFDDYLFVDGQIEDKAERKKWRNKIFAKARQGKLSDGVGQ
ncbi:SWIM zinc finger family protein [Chitinophaga qingshengii]|uniref:SWIM-type domain-containing protein n=1 Tax=Chitinophaga qingshengii TaxID=1569794 RepID=A0ABR7TLF3_9BACT|nr:hypothetical protein [Chitinophaga qingshengii]MBC9931328.1 hypothetical protein [Chitinophaga qingshengii]